MPLWAHSESQEFADHSVIPGFFITVQRLPPLRNADRHAVISKYVHRKADSQAGHTEHKKETEEQVPADRDMELVLPQYLPAGFPLKFTGSIRLFGLPDENFHAFSARGNPIVTNFCYLCER